MLNILGGLLGLAVLAGFGGWNYRRARRTARRLLELARAGGPLQRNPTAETDRCAAPTGVSADDRESGSS